MRPKQQKTTGEGDLFRARLDQIIDMKHELVQLAGRLDWGWLDAEIAPLYSDNGRPGVATRFVLGLLLLKHVYVTTNRRAPGGQFVLHAAALPGNPYDGHTLRDMIAATERLTGCSIERAYVDKGYRGHDTENPHRVFISGQKRGVFGIIKRELRRRSAIEAVIGHLKTDGHLGRCHLKGSEGDAANAILSAAGHNLRLILVWLRALLCLILAALREPLSASPLLKSAS